MCERVTGGIVSELTGIFLECAELRRGVLVYTPTVWVIFMLCPDAQGTILPLMAFLDAQWALQPRLVPRVPDPDQWYLVHLKCNSKG